MKTQNKFFFLQKKKNTFQLINLYCDVIIDCMVYITNNMYIYLL